jgi:hypothetical protein
VIEPRLSACVVSAANNADTAPNVLSDLRAAFGAIDAVAMWRAAKKRLA